MFFFLSLSNPLPRPTCDFCGVVCGLVWFQQKIFDQRIDNTPEMVLCVKCFTEKNFPDILSEKDFIKMDLYKKLMSNENSKQGQGKQQKQVW